MEKYLKRVADKILQKKLLSKGAVLIEGAKWCGKTTTASMQAKSILYMQEPNKVKQNLELAEIKPSKLLEGEVPRLIDEWHMAPTLWDAIRFEVDKRDKFGQFILTGSSLPPDSSKIYHSGTGRITRLLMRPMSLYESLDSTGSVSLDNIFNNEDIEGSNNLDIKDIAFLICRGGWPKAINETKEIALQQSYDYYDAIINIDISKVDNISKNPQRVSKLMRSLSRAVSTQTSFTSIVKDIKANENDDISDETIKKYINALKKLFVIENSEAWNPNLRSKTAIRTSDTWYFVDPSIATAALGANENDLLNDLELMGLLFENLCIRDLRIYLEAIDGNLYHYRDKSGLECDAVLHLRNGKYGLVEIKLGGETLIEQGIKTLSKLERNIDTQKMMKPSFKMILTAVGNYAYKNKDDIYIVPLGCLAP